MRWRPRSLARQYWKLEGQPERVKIISLKYGYHGVHLGGRPPTAIQPSAAPTSRLRLASCRWNRPSSIAIRGRRTRTSSPRSAPAISIARSTQGADTVAAFIAEPVQGAGGVIVPPATYWPKVREICDRHGVLLISDEVVTGFGRTGSLFGARGWGVAPDIMALAKGINSGYIPRRDDRQRTRRRRMAQGPSACCDHARIYLFLAPASPALPPSCQQIVRDEDLTGNAERVGAYFLERLHWLKDRHAAIGDVRGRA